MEFNTQAGSPVDKARGSEQARRRDCARETLEGGLPLQSFPDLRASLGALTGVELEFDKVPPRRCRR